MREKNENLIRELASEVLETCQSKENNRRKELWIKHNNLEGSGNILINLHLWKMADHPVWHEIITEDEIKSTNQEDRFVERQLRQKLFKFKKIDDDDVILPSVWITAVPANDEPTFGLKPHMETPDNVMGSKKFRSVINNVLDIKKLKKTETTINEKNTADKAARIREICGGILPVKVILPQIGTSPFENVVQFRSMDEILYDFYDQPELIHTMMDFFTNSIIEDYIRLEKLYGFDPESTWDFRIHFDRLEKPGKPGSLANCWAYISAQSAGIISPFMFEEFIQPYHERIAAIFGKVYYHGCEDLTQKAAIISQLPNLRRFHISPWSDIDSILDELGNKFVYETHVHPSNHLFLHDDEKIKQDVRELALKCKNRGVTADINLSDIETIHGEPDKLIRWSALAREAVESIGLQSI